MGLCKILVWIFFILKRISLLSSDHWPSLTNFKNKIKNDKRRSPRPRGSQSSTDWLLQGETQGWGHDAIPSSRKPCCTWPHLSSVSWSPSCHGRRPGDSGSSQALLERSAHWHFQQGTIYRENRALCAHPDPILSAKVITVSFIINFFQPWQ